METVGMFISLAGMIGFFWGLWKWRQASKAKQVTRKAKVITGVAVVIFYLGAALLGSVSFLETAGVLLSLFGGYFLVTSVWHLIRYRKVSSSKRRSVIVAISAVILFVIGGTMVNASPEGKEANAQSERIEQQAKSQKVAAESSKKAAAERGSAKIKRVAKKQAKTKALAKAQSRSKAAAKSSRKAVAAAKRVKAAKASRKAIASAKRAKAAKAAAASSKSIRQAAESASRTKAASESSAAAASSSVAQEAAASSSRTAAAVSQSKAQEAAAASSQAAVTETTAQTDNDQQTVYVTASGNKYHFDRNCRGLRRANSVSSMTLAEARGRGYTKCAFE